MRLILKPLADSRDQVLICDHTGVAMGSIHLDAFLDGPRGEIYHRLWNDETVAVELTPAREPVEA